MATNEQPAADHSNLAGDEDPAATSIEAAASDAPPASSEGPAADDRTPSVAPRWKRILRALMRAALPVALVLLAGNALVRWSIYEHKRLLLEAEDKVVAEHREKPLFRKGVVKGRYEQYRAPALVRTKRGTLLAFAEARMSDDDYKGIDLVVRRSTNNGKSWTQPQIVHADPAAASGNPTPVVDQESGKVLLAFRLTQNVGRGKRLRPLLVVSDDDGVTWSSPRDLGELAARPKTLPKNASITPGPGHGLQLTRGPHKGRLLFPTYEGFDTRSKLQGKDDGHSYALYSDDGGATWAFGKPTDYGGENSLAELSDGSALMVIRTRALASSARMKRFAVSRDGGSSWQPSYESQDIVESVCQTPMLRLGELGKKKDLLVLTSPAVQATERWDKTARRDLTVYVSSDDGRSWTEELLAHPGGASYSDFVTDDAGGMHLIFEVGIKNKPWGGAINHLHLDRRSFATGEGLTDQDKPFSEHVYEAYRQTRGPLEEVWHKVKK